MKIFSKMVKITTALVVIFAFIACEDDFGSVGADIIGDNNFDADLNDEAVVSAESYQIDAVQTNNLSSNLLGVYNDPVYGTRSASILTQLSLSNNAPDFGNQPVLDSVILSVPYYVRSSTPNLNGSTSYTLDSIYGNSPFKLSIIESNYFLNEYDPSTDFEERQKYFSNQQAEFEAHLTNNVLYEENFTPSSSEVVNIVGEGEEADTVRVAPRLRIALPVDFFNEKIVSRQGSAVLSNNNNFRNYLRGLFLKAEPINDEGSMMLLNLIHEDAGIALHYTHQVEDPDSETDATVPQSSTYRLNFTGTRVNTFNNSFVVPNDNNLYISGGAGAVTVLDLFTEEQLENFRANKWMINEANLTFHVHQDIVAGGSKEPERIFIYDIERNVPLLDYYYDASSNNNPMNSKIVHLGRLERDSDNNGVRYKVRLTEHINNVLNQDSTNVKLGVVVSQNVDIVSNAAVRDNEEVDAVPTSTVMSPKGTVFYGPDAADEEKRLKLRIYYTEIESN